MFKHIVRVLLGALLLTTLLAGTVLAQGPITPQHSDPFWQASYWSNQNFVGAPAIQRGDANLDFDWGYGSPDPAIPADRFSARWSRYIETAAGVYRFNATSDDGMRVWVDGDLIINVWTDHSVQTNSADKPLTAGHHLIIVEFYENAGLAVARLNWAPVSAGNVWRGEYFANPDLAGAPVTVRDDASINFDWGRNSPIPGVLPADLFSVRWTRDVTLPAGMYRFTVVADDGVRLWVNGHPLIDAWRDQAATTYTGDLYLPGGSTSLRMEFYDRYEFATARLSWSSGSSGGTPGGTVIVDDADAGFLKGGLASSWRVAYEGHAGRLYWTRNNDRTRAGYNWANWYPSLSAGRYEVFVYIPDRYSTTHSARYWVSHADGYTQRYVDQSANSGRWVSLGTYRFRGTRSDYVSLSDVTYEGYLSQLIAFDAVKWEPR